jgi:short-subunit dehydrogenase
MSEAAQSAGRVALITGANRGIGRSLALGLAERGISVGLLGRRESALREVGEQCRRFGVDSVVGVADLLDRPAVESAVRDIGRTLGGIGLLVNNAGVIESAEDDFVGTDVDETWRVVETNVRGPMLVTHAVLAGMLAAGGGRVVNINSGSGYRPSRVYTGYGVSKGALARFTSLLDAQFRDRGIYVFDVAPGVVVTDMTSSMPMHAERTAWTDPADVVQLVADIAAGTLDTLAGRFFRAGTDTAESLLAQADRIVERHARTVRLAPIDDADPLA